MAVILFNKPFGVLSQFTDSSTASSPSQTLSDFINIKGVYPAGRLDKDSEGLLVLTDDGRLQARISNPKFKQPKTYWAQVEGEPTDDALQHLERGVELKDGLTKPAQIHRMPPPPNLWPRTPPIRVRKSVPDSWVKLTLTEGRNRQVRRMTAHIGHPTLRLIRASVGAWNLDQLASGEYRSV